MSHLSSEQLAELTARVNARLDEFDGDFFHVTRGHVRLVHDVVREFWEQGAPAAIGPMPVRPAQHTPLPDGNRAHWRRWLIPPEAQHAQATGNGVHAMQVCEEPAAAEDAPPQPVEKLTSLDAPKASNGRANDEKLTGADHSAIYTAEYDLLRTLAVDGIMPRQSDYDEAKTEDMPNSTRLKQLIGLTWGQLASELGLRMITPAMRATEARLAQRAELATEPETATAAPVPLPRTLAEVDAEAAAQAQLTAEGEAVRTMVSSLSDANRARRAALQDKAFALLRGLAVDGVMPPLSLYNARREEAGLPDARLLLAQLGCDEWGDLAAAAGLRWHAYGKR